MAEENDLEAVGIITNDMDEAQRQTLQANECFKGIVLILICTSQQFLCQFR